MSHYSMTKAGPCLLSILAGASLAAVLIAENGASVCEKVNDVLNVPNDKCLLQQLMSKATAPHQDTTARPFGPIVS